MRTSECLICLDSIKLGTFMLEANRGCLFFRVFGEISTSTAQSSAGWMNAASGLKS
jgi:hypothetical protein